MADVLFKRGASAQLPAKGGAIEGAFYLTTDTRRLFIGDSNKNAVPLCETVQIVSEVATLPAAADVIQGQFYYATKENILCIHKDGGWVQINPDTNTILSTVKTTVNASNNKGTVTVEYEDQNDASLGSHTFSIAASTGLELSAADKVITIEGATYSLGASAASNVATVKLTGAGTGENSEVKITAGNAVTLTNTDEGFQIGVDMAEINVDYSIEDKKPANGYSYELVDENDVPHGAITINPTLQVKDKDGNATSGVKIKNDVATIDAYSTATVDAKLTSLKQELNAMTYKGTISQFPPTGSIGNGDTFLYNSKTPVEYPAKSGQYIEQGDLVIAQGTESNGVIANPTWDVVKSGDDVDTTYDLTINTESKKVVLTNNASGTPTEFFIKEDGTTPVKVTASADGFTIAHDKKAGTAVAASTTKVEAKDGATFNAVSSLKVDNWGHVSDVVLTPVNVKDQDTILKSISTSASTSGNTTTVTTAHKLVNINGGDAGTVNETMKFVTGNSNLTITGSGDTVTMDLVWDTF